MKSRGPAESWLRSMLACALLLGSLSAYAQRLGTYNRITTPNGRTVFELRQGMHPANSRLLFTAAITGGPTGGTTTVVLQQALVGDIFNQNAPAAGWTVVRSTATAFSLGGGCGRNNLIDFPYINNFRPEILRITGTTHQVITLDIAGTDQYDSIDCRTQRDGRVLYMLTNRTRQRLELRREQGGLLQLVRDNFGAVATPFSGGQRPSFNIFYRRPGLIAPGVDVDRPAGEEGDDLIEEANVLYDFLGPAALLSERVQNFIIDEFLATLYDCGLEEENAQGPSSPKDTVALRRKVAGNFQGNGQLSEHPTPTPNPGTPGLDSVAGSCTVQPPRNLGSAGPFSLYSFAGLAGVEGFARPGLSVPLDIIVAPNQVVTDDGMSRDVQPSPYGNRGGPVHGCGMFGSEIEGGMMLAGPGTVATEVQQSVFKADVSEILFGTGMEAELDGIGIHCDPQVPR